MVQVSSDMPILRWLGRVPTTSTPPMRITPVEGEPYTVAPGSRFMWFRGRMLGGRTNHWGRISLRFGPDDFRRGSMDGLGDDWPIDYIDVAPYYDRVDRLIGIFGSSHDTIEAGNGAGAGSDQQPLSERTRRASWRSTL